MLRFDSKGKLNDLGIEFGTEPLKKGRLFVIKINLGKVQVVGFLMK